MRRSYYIHLRPNHNMKYINILYVLCIVRTHTHKRTHANRRARIVYIRGSTSARPKCGLISTDGARSLNPSSNLRAKPIRWDSDGPRASKNGIGIRALCSFCVLCTLFWMLYWSIYEYTLCIFCVSYIYILYAQYNSAWTLYLFM